MAVGFSQLGMGEIRINIFIKNQLGDNQYIHSNPKRFRFHHL